MSDAWHELMKKVKSKSLRDLKEAISSIKKTGMDKESDKMEKDEKPQPAAPQQAQEPKAADPHMSLLERRKLGNGSIQFLIGHAGHPEYYEMHVDLHAKRKGHPSVTISKRSQDGSLLSRCNQLHNDYDSAIKSIVKHKNTKDW